jgi:hypothetical protein
MDLICDSFIHHSLSLSLSLSHAQDHEFLCDPDAAVFSMAEKSKSVYLECLAADTAERHPHVHFMIATGLR